MTGKCVQKNTGYAPVVAHYNTSIVVKLNFGVKLNRLVAGGKLCGQ